MTQLLRFQEQTGGQRSRVSYCYLWFRESAGILQKLYHNYTLRKTAIDIMQRTELKGKVIQNIMNNTKPTLKERKANQNHIKCIQIWNFWTFKMNNCLEKFLLSHSTSHILKWTSNMCSRFPCMGFSLSYELWWEPDWLLEWGTALSCKKVGLFK